MISIKYCGGKVRIAKKLIEKMPHCGDRFFDLFAGGGNILFNAFDALDFDKWILNDLYNYPLFQSMKIVNVNDMPDTMTKELFMKYKNSVSVVGTVIEPRITWGGKGYEFFWNNNTDLRGYKNTVRECKRILGSGKVQITKDDAIEKLEKGDFNDFDFIYLDPPYEGRFGRMPYPNIDHKRLLTALLDLKCQWMLSGYTSDLYVQYLGYPTYEFYKHGNLGNFETLEAVWTNY